MAVEFRLGNRRAGRREHDHQRRYARDAVVGGAQGDDCGGVVSSMECTDGPPPVLFAKCATRMGTRQYWLRSTPEYRENSLTRLWHGGRCRGPSTPHGLHFVKFMLRSG